MIYQLKISLKHMRSPVWRRVQVDSQTTFFILHKLIQEAFEWEDAHLHEFSLKSQAESQLAFFESSHVRIGDVDVPDDFDFDSILDETKETIEDHLKEEKDKALYIYDFGDDWKHEILLETILLPEEKVAYPRCLKAKGQAPEEDSMGMWEDEETFEPEVNETSLIQEINKRFEQYWVEPEQDPEKAAEQRNWHELFQAVDQFKTLKPWHQFWSDQVIVVDDPDSEELAYGCIMGKGGDEFGLAVYLGNSGLKSLQNAMENPDETTTEDIIEQRSLLLSLVDREELETEDYALIKRLGLSFRGKKQWPMLRSLKPGYYPWGLDQQEVRTLRVVLEQVIEVARQFKHDPEQVPEYHYDGWLARAPYLNGQELDWENTKMMSKLIEPSKEPAAILVPEMDVERVKKRLKRYNANIEFDAHYFPEPVQENEGERPYFPNMVLAADQKTDQMVFHKMLGHDQYEKNLQAAFLQVIEQIDGIPREVWVENEDSQRILEHLFEALSIQMMKVAHLPLVTDFREEMFGNGQMF